MKRPQSGFTLVEIAIVLVIIGLLLGGVLKGQELVNSAKVKTLVNDFKTVPLFIYGYQDKFRALPGDDSTATAHLGSTALVASNTNKTLNNGRIDGAYNSVTNTDESLVFWQHVRLANLATGPTNFSDATNITASVPRNSEGGRIGVQSDIPISGMTGSYFVCSDSIQGKFAKQIDITMDDGNTASGSVQVIGSKDATTGAVSAVTTTNIVDSGTYTVCASF